MHFWQKAAAAPDAQCSLTRSQEHLSNERTMDIGSGSSWNRACLFFLAEIVIHSTFIYTVGTFFLCFCMFVYFVNVFYVALGPIHFFSPPGLFVSCFLLPEKDVLLDFSPGWFGTAAATGATISLFGTMLPLMFLFLINTGKMPPFHYFCGESVIFIYMPPPPPLSRTHTERR